MKKASLMLIKAGIQVSNGKIRKDDLARATFVLSNDLSLPESIAADADVSITVTISGLPSPSK
jgi:hypothetical protein